jgi:hypothetical protein
MPKLSRSRVRDLIEAVKSSLADLAQAEGLVISFAGARFTDSSLRLTLNLSVVDDTGTVLTPEHVAWTQLATTFGLNPEWLGQEFTYSGNRYRVIGLNRRARRMPVKTVQVASGKPYKFPAALVKYAFTER